MTGTGGTRRSGGPAGVSTTDQEHGRATPETPGVRVHTLTAEEKGAWVDDINARMAALAPTGLGPDGGAGCWSVRGARSATLTTPAPEPQSWCSP